MRLTSDMFVSALMRRVFNDGGYCAVEKKGAHDAGAIFIRVIHKDGCESLYGPAPQSFLSNELDSSERLFECRLSHATPLDVSELMAKEQRFDHDIWILDIACDGLETYITLMPQ